MIRDATLRQSTTVFQHRFTPLRLRLTLMLPLTKLRFTACFLLRQRPAFPSPGFQLFLQLIPEVLHRHVHRMLRLRIICALIIAVCEAAEPLQYFLRQLQLLVLAMPDIEHLLPAALRLRQCRLCLAQLTLCTVRTVLLPGEIVPLLTKLLLSPCEALLHHEALLYALLRFLELRLIGLKGKYLVDPLRELIREEALRLIVHALCLHRHILEAVPDLCALRRLFLLQLPNLCLALALIVLLLLDPCFLLRAVLLKLRELSEQLLLLLLQLVSIALSELLPLLLHRRLL